MGGDWTAHATLPGGDFPQGRFEIYLEDLRGRHPWLPADLARHYGRLYGTRAERLLNGASSLDDLGRHFGGGLYEAEIDYLRKHEWAKSAADVLLRRTKSGLHVPLAGQMDVESYLGR
jgi:glycerol-3-phosphate dehydrogenase